MYEIEHGTTYPCLVQCEQLAVSARHLLRDLHHLRRCGAVDTIAHALFWWQTNSLVYGE
jgi:hypothetical protein